MTKEISENSRQWIALPDNSAKAEALARACNISPLVASLLLNRSISTPEDVKRFIHPDINELHDPFLLKGMHQAVERIMRAIQRREKILVWGDYDVDGTISTALLNQFLTLIGGDCIYHIPSRLYEGYGLNKPKIDEYKDKGIKLLITVDTGVGSVEEIEYAQSLGIDVIITDHHVAGDKLPPALCIVNPKQPDCNYPHDYLAGVGVAFKLIWALAEKLSPQKRASKEFIEFLDNSLGLVAIATIVDVVPMLDENRIFVKYGLASLSKSTNPGIRALLEMCNLENGEIDPTHIGFRLGPRLNAGGRLGKEDLGVQLILSDSYSKALEIVSEMEDENKNRQGIEKLMLENAIARVEKEIDLDKNPVIVIASSDWHVGVIGIVATRLTEEYWRPAILISIDGKVGRGSARSVMQFNIYEALKQCEDLLITFGGHNYAAGLEIRVDKIDEFRRRLNEIALKTLKVDALSPMLLVEKQIMLSELSLEMIRDIEKLAPFGEGNKPPVFSAGPLALIGKPKIIGRDDNHLTFYVKDSFDPAPRGIRAVAFNKANFYAKLVQNADSFSLAFTPRINSYYGNPIVELVVKDIHFP